MFGPLKGDPPPEEAPNKTKKTQESSDVCPGTPETDGGCPEVRLPPSFIQIHCNLTDFKPKNLLEGPVGSTDVATPSFYSHEHV